MESRRILRVSGNVKLTSDCGNEGISAHKPFRREAEAKLPEDVPESLREKVCLLLDEGGSRWDFFGQEIKIFQQFMVDASASRAEEEMDQLYKPRFPAVGKILSGVSDELGSVARHVIHDCPECGFELLWE